MKRLISLVLTMALVLTSVVAFAAPVAEQHTVQNNIFIEGKVGAQVAGEKLLLTITKGEEVVYIADYADAVKTDGSYAIKFKHTGDLTGAEVNVKYAGEDVTSSAVKATSTTQIMEADVYVTDANNRNFNLDIDQSMPTYTFEANSEYNLKEQTYQEDYEIPAREGLKAVVNLKNKFAYESGMDIMVAAYGENNKLLMCKVEHINNVSYAENGETAVYETAEYEVPEGTKYAKAFCWSSTSNLIPYGKEGNGDLPKVTVFCIGDSTGQTWARRWYPQAGWGTYLQDYLDPEYATVYNNCTSGAWAQSIMNNKDDSRHPDNTGKGGFWGQGDWYEIEAKWKKGDYVLVCLGINDAAETDKDGKYTDTEWFKMAYEEMIKRASAAGVTVIFMSATPSATNQSTRVNFNAVAKQLAEENGIVYLDHASKMLEVYAQSPDTVTQDYYLHRETFLKPVEEGGYGLTEEEIANHGNESIRGTKADDGNYYYNGTKTGGADTTHISIKGANLACQKIVECLKESNSPLRFYVK